MQPKIGFGLLLLCAGGLCAQGRGRFVNPTPFLQGATGNVVFPGGTSAMPGIQRSFGNVVFPGGSGQRLVVPFSVTDPTFLFRPGAAGRLPRGLPVTSGSGIAGNGRRRGGPGVLPYAVPVYIGGGGGFYDNPYIGDGALPQAPNTTIVFPPVQQQMVASPYDAGVAAVPAPPAPAEPAFAEPQPPEPEHYLIAFKDHTIYAAVAFYVEGDTVHYFTSGNQHNQVSLSLIDKDLTQRLNREAGIDMHLQ
jgi:hypothetical protein